MEEIKKYDLIIVGAGPAGLSASVYASRFGIKHAVFDGRPGGTISTAHAVDNYLGIENISGFDLSKKFIAHAKKFGIEISSEIVEKIEKNKEDFFVIFLGSGGRVLTKTLLLATGIQRRKIGIKGEDKFFGKGVSYCATCDGFFYKNKVVGVFGETNSAVSDAVYLADVAQKVYLICKKDRLLAEDHWVNLAKQNKKIEILLKSGIKEVLGEKKVEKIRLDNSLGENKEVALNGIFIDQGSNLNMEIKENLGIEKDEAGFIKIKKDGATSVLGVWAAGDATDGSNKLPQVITAAAEGAIAAKGVYDYLRKNKQNDSIPEKTDWE